MRDIKFRVYDTVNKCFISDMSNFWINPYFTAMMEWRPEFDGQTTFDLNDSLIFQQYTGLKDKNGVEIYEGDLLTYRSFTTIYLVDFNNENYGYVMGWNLLEYGYFKDGIFSECEKVEYSNSNTVNYPASEYYYGKCPTNNEIDGLDPYYEVVGNIFEGVDK